VTASPESPVYAKVAQDEDWRATKLFMITVDEGWRSSIMCTGMYEWAADWLVSVLQGKPYAPSAREHHGIGTDSA
jgi:hypothetical protein